MRPEELDAPEAYRFPELPEGLVAVTEKSMPRLFLALDDALDALGARGMTVALNPLGGVEAWQGAPQVIVLGAGALAAFGQSELTYLCALALAFGEGGHKLAEPGDVEGFAEAAVRAFEMPSPSRLRPAVCSRSSTRGCVEPTRRKCSSTRCCRAARRLRRSPGARSRCSPGSAELLA